MPFTPHFGHLFGHEGSKYGLPVAPMLRFSQVYDLDRFAEEVGFGVVEWSELKEGRAGRNGGDIYEDEWMTEDEKRAIREERPTAEDWPSIWSNGEYGERTDTLGW
jgi:hypothetical protein